MSKSAYLILQNGSVFEGKSFGAARESVGELVFTTAMTGYLETLTDPSYYGQLVIQTFPLIGNYGVIPADFESERPALSGYIVKEWCEAPSNFRCEYDLDRYLKDSGVPGLHDVNTRQLTRIVRQGGAMNAKILYREPTEEDFAQLRAFAIKDAVASVTRAAPSVKQPDGARFRVALLDFGTKAHIIRCLTRRGCAVTVLPSSTTAEQITALAPDGIALSNGPGDPVENTAAIGELKKLSETGIPMFGICLGHQLLALSQGAKTVKLKFGHRGANQPVCDTETGRVFITSQNHGYAVLSDTLPKHARESFYNCNDRSCEGVSYKHFPGFSVQFHPEACAGPLDTGSLFDKFVAMMEEHKCR